MLESAAAVLVGAAWRLVDAVEGEELGEAEVAHGAGAFRFGPGVPRSIVSHKLRLHRPAKVIGVP
ncbi:hypothetical protein GCM10010272_47550 [Streptomyces lateritius]|nr:hypothetical protein GCM10010272_47550 [Streptomyces lateritius]